MGRRQDEHDGSWIYDTRIDEFEHLRELTLKADRWEWQYGNATMVGAEIVSKDLTDCQFRLLAYQRMVPGSEDGWDTDYLAQITDRPHQEILDDIESIEEWHNALLTIRKADQRRKEHSQRCHEEVKLQQKKPKPPSKNEVVYFLKSGGLVKIGTSGNIAERIDGLRRSSPTPIELLATIPGGRHIEKKLHLRFAKHRKHGEWFDPAPEILDYLNEVVL